MPERHQTAENLNKELIVFISERSGVEEQSITYALLIEDDLGVTGDDAENIIAEYSREFDVDITGFKFDEYFYPEPSVFFNFYNMKIKPLTVGHLAKGIKPVS